MSALLHQTLDAMAGDVFVRLVAGRTLTIPEMSGLVVALKDASERARAIEGANVVPWPRTAASPVIVNNTGAIYTAPTGREAV